MGRDSYYTSGKYFATILNNSFFILLRKTMSRVVVVRELLQIITIWR